jgi:hypothetical protein
MAFGFPADSALFALQAFKHNAQLCNLSVQPAFVIKFEQPGTNFSPKTRFPRCRIIRIIFKSGKNSLQPPPKAIARLPPVDNFSSCTLPPYLSFSLLLSLHSLFKSDIPKKSFLLLTTIPPDKFRLRPKSGLFASPNF